MARGVGVLQRHILDERDLARCRVDVDRKGRRFILEIVLTVRVVVATDFVTADDQIALLKQLDVAAVGGLEAGQCRADLNLEGQVVGHSLAVGAIVDDSGDDGALRAGITDGRLEGVVDVGVVALVVHRSKQARIVDIDVVATIVARRFVMHDATAQRGGQNLRAIVLDANDRFAVVDDGDGVGVRMSVAVAIGGGDRKRDAETGVAILEQHRADIIGIAGIAVADR